MSEPSGGGGWKNMKKAVSWAIKGVMHVRWWCFLFVSYAHYLALFVGGPLWDPGGKNVQLFLYFHCKYVNNTINCSCGSILSFFAPAFCRVESKGRFVHGNNWNSKRKTIENVRKEQFIDKYNDFIQYLNTHSISLGQFHFIFSFCLKVYALDPSCQTPQWGICLLLLSCSWLHQHSAEQHSERAWRKTLHNRFSRFPLCQSDGSCWKHGFHSFGQ